MGVWELPEAGHTLQNFQFFAVSPYFRTIKLIQSAHNQVYQTPWTSIVPGKLKFWKYLEYWCSYGPATSSDKSQNLPLLQFYVKLDRWSTIWAIKISFPQLLFTRRRQGTLNWLYSPTMCPVPVQGRHRRRSEIGVFVSFMPHQTPEMQSGHLKPVISNICALEHG